MGGRVTDQAVWNELQRTLKEVHVYILYINKCTISGMYFIYKCD